MRNALQHIPSTDQVRYAFIAMLIALMSFATFSHGDLTARATQAALTGSERGVTQETETVENYEAEKNDTAAKRGYVHPEKVAVLPPEQIDTETLWLARALYSETKRPEEQELVAWSIRNRVETDYRGERSYQGVVLDRYQFSAFNPGNRKRGYFTSLTPYSVAKGWQKTLSIAKMVKDAPETLRPFPKTTRHYYSERSMVGRSQPDWAIGETPVKPERDYRIAADRFRFYDSIA